MTEDQNKNTSEENKLTNDLLIMLAQQAVKSDKFKQIIKIVDYFKKNAEALYSKFYEIMKNVEFEPERFYIIAMLGFSKKAVDSNKLEQWQRQSLEKSSAEVQRLAIEFIVDNNIESKLRRKIFSAMYASFGMGLTVEDRKIALAEWEATRANIARQGRQIKAAKRKASLRDAVLAVVADLREVPADSEKFAERIRPAVRERLGQPREGLGYPSITSIRRVIRDYKSSN